MYKYIQKSWKLVIVLAITCSLMVAPTSAHAAESKDLNRLFEVYSLLAEYHLSGVPEEVLSKGAIYGMLWQLDDPYTDYFTKEEWQEYSSSIEQAYAGIGVRIGEDDKGIYIDEVFDNTPAAAADLKRGDYIVEVDGKSTKGWNTHEVTEKVRGPESSDVQVTILRGSERINKSITRQFFAISPVKTEWLGSGIGYLELSSFSMDAADLFAKELSMLEANKMTTLVLDLRNNSGGYIHTAQEIAGRLLGDKTLMYEVDRYGQTYRMKTTGNYKPVDYKIMVLVNGGSASASELLAGALQDYGVGTLIGEQTFGKGSMQQIVTLSDGSVLKITTDEYLTPLRRAVNDIGLAPDIEVLGSVPQLLTALIKSGTKQITLEKDMHRLKLNGVLMDDAFDYIEQNNRLYVPSRTLGALVGADISWNGTERAVKFTVNKQSVSFKVGSQDIIQESGTTYVDIASFAKAFSQFNYTWGNEKLTIRYK